MIFVTGAGGYIGRELVPLLTERGAQVRIGAVRELPRDMEQGGSEQVRLDMADSSSLVEALRGCDRLFLLSPFWIDQVETETRLVDAAHRAGVDYIVKQSVAGADEGGAFPLAARHRAIEKHIRKLNIRHAFLHPSPFMQDFLLYGADMIRSEDRFMRPEGEGSMSFVDARDAAAVAAEVLLGDKNEDVGCRVTGPEAITNYQAAQILSKVLHRSIRYVDVLGDDFRNWLRAEGVNDREIDMLLELHQINGTGLAAEVTSTVRDVTGREPTPFVDFVREHRAAFEAPRQTVRSEAPSEEARP